jgi:hypothetical protein
MSEVKVTVQSSIWKGIVAIVLLIVVGAGIWAYNNADRTITLGWDAMPAGQQWASVRIYDISLVPEVIVAEAQCSVGPPINCPTQVAFTMTKAAHVWVARAWDGYWESGDSNSVSVPGPPVTPSNLIKK